MDREFQDCPTIQAVLDSTLAQGLCLSGAELGNVQLMDWSAGYLQIAAQRGFDQEFLTVFKHVAAGDGSACARALRKGEPVVLEDVMVDAEFAPFRIVADHAGFRGVQSTPMVSSSGATVGMLSTHFKLPHRPSSPTMAALRHLSRAAADAVIFRRAAMLDTTSLVRRAQRSLDESYGLLRRQLRL